MSSFWQFFDIQMTIFRSGPSEEPEDWRNVKFWRLKSQWVELFIIVIPQPSCTLILMNIIDYLICHIKYNIKIHKCKIWTRHTVFTITASVSHLTVAGTIFRITEIIVSIYTGTVAYTVGTVCSVAAVWQTMLYRVSPY